MNLNEDTNKEIELALKTLTKKDKEIILQIAQRLLSDQAKTFSAQEKAV